MAVKTEVFGTSPEGTQIHTYTLQNQQGIQAVLTDLGAVLVKLVVPDKDGTPTDVVLGFDDVQGYLGRHPHFGAIIGRNGNRIAGGSFEIGGVRYQLVQNQKGNNLHSGPDYYEHRMWEVVSAEENAVTFALDTPDGDQGFPGAFHVEVTYSLSEDNALAISYEGKADRDTVANMTNHSYFNLNGEGSGTTVLNHMVRFNADSYTPVTDDKAIPDGTIASVKDTPFDFGTFHSIGERIDEDFDQLTYTGGYDHNYVLKREASPEMVPVGEVYSPDTGIRMSVETDCVGFQFYTGNGLTGEVKGKGGRPCGRREAFCIETQFFPDAVNQKSFPSPILKAGETYRTKTVYRFGLA